MTIDELTERGFALAEQIKELHDKYGEDPEHQPAGVRHRLDSLVRGLRAVDADITAREQHAERMEQIRQRAIADPSLRESGAPTPPSRSRHNPWRDLDRGVFGESMNGYRQRAMDCLEVLPGIPTANRARLADAVDRDQSGNTALFTVAASDPAYLRAFTALMRDPLRGHLVWDDEERTAFARVEHMRTAMSLTDANGGVLVPYTLDPTVILSSAGAVNPFRRIARLETTTSEDANYVVSDGLTSEWLAEAAEAADGSPTFTKKTLTPAKLASFVVASYEILQDSNFVDQFPRLLADSFDTTEAAAFAVGSGSGAPQGVITGVAAVTTSRVAPTTAGQFGVQDVYKLDNAIPARARASKSLAWVAHPETLNRIRQFDTYGGSSFWADLNSGAPATLLGHPVYASTAMTATVTTGTNLMVLGDFSDFIICDRIGVIVTTNQWIVGSNHRPTGQTGLFAHKRVGSLVASPASFRVLQL